MQPWEKRLRDLSRLLENCQDAYFDPDLFRMNTNQFLQTARTVTFIIQKDKAIIPSFDAWYAENVIAPWSGDGVMTWAKDSRNKIEKQGDLELHSSLVLSLIFSYLEHEDISVACGRKELVSANIKRLIRLARRDLPSGISDVAVVKIDRRWIANSLPDWELLGALKYIYGRIYHVATSLACHLGIPLDESVPSVDQLSLKVEAQRTSYIKLNDMHPASLRSKSVRRDPDFVPPTDLVEWMEKSKSKPVPINLHENVEFYAEFAKRTFEQFGNHIPMLYMCDEQSRVIHLVSAYFDDQATKYLFWRSIADRVLYLKPRFIFFVSEAWRRSGFKDFPQTLMRNMPIVGESLQVVGLDSSGNTAQITWNICREGHDSAPRLELTTDKNQVMDMSKANFFHPIRKAFEKLSQTSNASASTTVLVGSGGLDRPLLAHCSSSSCEIAFAEAAVREGPLRQTSRLERFSVR